jgi:hypothetical protein
MQRFIGNVGMTILTGVLTVSRDMVAFRIDQPGCFSINIKRAQDENKQYTCNRFFHLSS